MRILLAAIFITSSLAMPVAPSLEAGEPWIISGLQVDAAADFAAAAGLPVFRLEHLDMAILSASNDAVIYLLQRFDIEATPDWQEDFHLDQSVPFIEAPPVRELVGSQLDGPTVLVVDTGISDIHPGFQSGNLAVNVRPEFTGGIIQGIVDNVPIVDMAGHGTHVAGIVAGSGRGTVSALDTEYEGVYSNGRVAGFQATMQVENGGQLSGQAALAAFNWALEYQDEYDIRVVTNSWGLPGKFDPDNLVEKATLQLYLAGMTVIFSAGNNGTEAPMNLHCMAPWVLCVAAADPDGSIASYSSRGSGLGPWDHPDITAPGSQIRSAEPMENPQGQQPGSSPVLYADRSGTSMAAPHVAGVAALITAMRPTLSPDQIMDILVATSRPMAESLDEAGNGFVLATAAATEASKTSGNLKQFLAGQEVKYAGALSGDDKFAVDPVSGGIDAPRGQPLIVADPANDFFVDPPVWFIAAAAGAVGLLLVVVLVVVIATRR